jgi:hypothetical protein
MRLVQRIEKDAYQDGVHGVENSTKLLLTLIAESPSVAGGLYQPFQ